MPASIRYYDLAVFLLHNCDANRINQILQAFGLAANDKVRDQLVNEVFSAVDAPTWRAAYQRGMSFPSQTEPDAAILFYEPPSNLAIYSQNGLDGLRLSDIRHTLQSRGVGRKKEIDPHETLAYYTMRVHVAGKLFKPRSWWSTVWQNASQHVFGVATTITAVITAVYTRVETTTSTTPLPYSSWFLSRMNWAILIVGLAVWSIFVIIISTGKWWFQKGRRDVA